MSTQPLEGRQQVGRPRGVAVRAVTGYVAAAAVLGVLADVGLRLGEQADFLFIVATPWVVLAFGAGRASGLRWSAVAGAAALLTGIAAYYAWLWVGQDVSFGILLGNGYNGKTWVLAAGVVGAAAGLVGGLSRLQQDLLAAAAWCGVAAVPCVDAIVQVAYAEGVSTAVVPVLGVVALALLVWGWRSGIRPWMLLLGLPVATLVLWQLELAVLQQVFHRLTWV